MVSALAVPGGAPPPPPSAPPAPLYSNAGPYKIDRSTVVDTSAADFTCCALEAELIVPDYIEGAASFTATLSAKANGCTAALSARPGSQLSHSESNHEPNT